MYSRIDGLAALSGAGGRRRGERVLAVQRVTDFDSWRIVNVMGEGRANSFHVTGLDRGDQLFVHARNVVRVLERLVIDDEEEPELGLPVPPDRHQGLVAGLLVEVAMKRQVLLDLGGVVAPPGTIELF